MSTACITQLRPTSKSHQSDSDQTGNRVPHSARREGPHACRREAVGTRRRNRDRISDRFASAHGEADDSWHNDSTRASSVPRPRAQCRSPPPTRCSSSSPKRSKGTSTRATRSSGRTWMDLQAGVPHRPRDRPGSPRPRTGRGDRHGPGDQKVRSRVRDDFATYAAPWVKVFMSRAIERDKRSSRERSTSWRAPPHDEDLRPSALEWVYPIRMPSSAAPPSSNSRPAV